MDTNGNIFDKNLKLIESLIHPESWKGIKGHLSGALFYSNVIREGFAGSLNDEQQHLMNIVNYHAEILNENLDIITMAFRLLFPENKIEIQDVNLLEGVKEFENELNKEKEKYSNSELQIYKVISKEPISIKGDTYLIQVAFKNLRRLIKQIHPYNQGTIHIEVRSKEGFVKTQIKRDKFDFTYENGLSIIPFEVNPEWFIVHTIAELHGGEFIVDDSHKDKCIFYLNLPLQQS